MAEDAARQPDDSDLGTPYVTLSPDGEARGDSSPRRPRRSAWVAGLLGLAACVALVVFLGYVVPSESGGWSLAWMAEAPGATEPAQDDGDTDESRSEGSAALQPDADGAPAPDAASSSSEPTDDAPAAGGPSEGQPAGSAIPASSGATSSSAAAPPAPQGAEPPAPAPAPEKPMAPDVLRITVSVSSDAAGGGVSASGTVGLAPGATAYDALCALGLDVRAQQSAYGTYVQAIGGLAEKDHGSSSGWMYAVNGRAAQVACSAYALADGDSVSWYYVTGM